MATSPKAKTAMTTFSADYTSPVAAIVKADAGDEAEAADVAAISAKVTSDSTAAKTVCGN